jgi:hypothetical protein
MDRISVQTNVLKANLEVAMENRRLFEAEGTVVINLMSAPGAGKTSLLEATIQGLRKCRKPYLPRFLRSWREPASRDLQRGRRSGEAEEVSRDVPQSGRRYPEQDGLGHGFGS